MTLGGVLVERDRTFTGENLEELVDDILELPDSVDEED